jgi:hypothetical protein
VKTVRANQNINSQHIGLESQSNTLLATVGSPAGSLVMGSILRNADVFMNCLIPRAQSAGDIFCGTEDR